MDFYYSRARRGGIYTLGSKNRSYFLYTRTPVNPPEDTESIIWDTTKEDIGVYVSPLFLFLLLLSNNDVLDCPYRKEKQENR